MPFTDEEITTAYTQSAPPPPSQPAAPEPKALSVPKVNLVVSTLRRVAAGDDWGPAVQQFGKFREVGNTSLADFCAAALTWPAVQADEVLRTAVGKKGGVDTTVPAVVPAAAPFTPKAILPGQVTLLLKSLLTAVGLGDGGDWEPVVVQYSKLRGAPGTLAELLTESLTWKQVQDDDALKAAIESKAGPTTPTEPPTPEPTIPTIPANPE